MTKIYILIKRGTPASIEYETQRPKYNKGEKIEGKVN